MNKYLKDFINLNDGYESALVKTRKKLDDQVDQRVDLIEQKVGEYA